MQNSSPKKKKNRTLRLSSTSFYIFKIVILENKRCACCEIDDMTHIFFDCKNHSVCLVQWSYLYNLLPPCMLQSDFQ